MLEMVVKANGFLWGSFLIILLCGAGAFFTVKLRFIQVREFGKGLRLLFAGFSLKGEKGKNGEMTPFQAISTAIAGQVGTGNLVGAATALISGGPGAIFWMWVSAFLGMSTIYAEAVLAQEYKVMGKDGAVTGGPVYYIQGAFKGRFGKVLATCFAVFIILALGFMGNMVQSNSIGTAFVGTFAEHGVVVQPIIIGVIVAVLAALVFIGGTARLAAVVEKIVPVMAVIYILGSIALLVMNFTEIPNAFKMIFVGAFSPQAVLGGACGIAVKDAMRYGVARGLFSNEAGMGSTPHAHARAKAKTPHEQGLIAMVSVFIDTFVILSLTAVSVLCTGAMESGASGVVLSQVAFSTSFGSFGSIFISVCLLFFAFSTIISWHFFGAINVKYLFGEKAVKIYSAIAVCFIVVGSTLKVDLVWELSDFFNGLMVIPNLLGVLALTGVVVKSTKNSISLEETKETKCS